MGRGLEECIAGGKWKFGDWGIIRGVVIFAPIVLGEVANALPAAGNAWFIAQEEDVWRRDAGVGVMKTPPEACRGVDFIRGAATGGKEIVSWCRW